MLKCQFLYPNGKCNLNEVKCWYKHCALPLNLCQYFKEEDYKNEEGDKEDCA